MSKIFWDNRYWRSYKNIEKRLIELSHTISYDDKQIHIYSEEFSDLVLSITSKIESVTKDFYDAHIYPYNVDKTQRDYTDHYFHTGVASEKTRSEWNLRQCLIAINDKMNLRDKLVNIDDTLFHFVTYPKQFFPFGHIEKNETSGKIKGGMWCESSFFAGPKLKKTDFFVDWLEAYNSLKHNYIQSIPRNGSLLNVLFSLAGLYILLIYLEFYDTNRYIAFSASQTQNDGEMDSEIFSVNIHNTTLDPIFESKLREMSNPGIENKKQSAVLLRILNMDVYSKTNQLINDFKGMYPEIDRIDIDAFQVPNRKEDIHKPSYVLFDKITRLNEEYYKHDAIILNQNSENDYSIYDINKNEFDEKNTIHIARFCTEVKVGDNVEIFFNYRIPLSGVLSRYENESMTINTQDSVKHTINIRSITRARIKA
ncbi:MAG: hypothetical protein ABII85_01370 [Bacillota bacterium]